MTPNSDLQFIHKESGNSMTTAKLQSARLLPHGRRSKIVAKHLQNLPNCGHTKKIPGSMLSNPPSSRVALIITISCIKIEY